jgi:Na+/melibiose symporter-like transporter
VGRPAPAGTHERLSLTGALTFALAQFPTSAMAIALLVYLPPHLTRDLGVPLAVVGVSWGAVRLLDVAIDPFLGLVMDRTVTPLGRYRPWLIAGAPILMAGVFMLFLAPAGIGRVYLIGWLLVLYLSLSIFMLALPAWGATLAVSYNDRARIYGALAAVGVASTIAIIVLPIAGGLAHKSDAWAVHAMGWVLIAATPLLIGIAVGHTRERINPSGAGHQGVRVADYVALVSKPDLLRCYAAQFFVTLGPGWMSSLFIFFSRDVMRFGGGSPSVLLLVYIAGGLIGAPLMAHLATRIGKHRTLMVATVCFSAGLCTILLPPKGMWGWAIPVNLWCGFMGASFEMTIRSMLADVADEVRLEQGKERLSLVFAINSVVTKLATASSIFITYPLLARVGYSAPLGAHNTPGALNGLALLFVVGPIGFVLLGGVAMLGWRMTAARHAGVRAELDARDALAALGEAEPVVEDDLAQARGLAE